MAWLLHPPTLKLCPAGKARHVEPVLEDLRAFPSKHLQVGVERVELLPVGGCVWSVLGGIPPAERDVVAAHDRGVLEKDAGPRADLPGGGERVQVGQVRERGPGIDLSQRVE